MWPVLRFQNLHFQSNISPFLSWKVNQPTDFKSSYIYPYQKNKNNRPLNYFRNLICVCLYSQGIFKILNKSWVEKSTNQQTLNYPIFTLIKRIIIIDLWNISKILCVCPYSQGIYKILNKSFVQKTFPTCSFHTSKHLDRVIREKMIWKIFVNSSVVNPQG